MIKIMNSSAIRQAFLDFFKEDEDGNAYVSKQPTTPADIELCQEQLEACPVASIGKDG